MLKKFNKLLLSVIMCLTTLFFSNTLETQARTASIAYDVDNRVPVNERANCVFTVKRLIGNGFAFGKDMTTFEAKKSIINSFVPIPGAVAISGGSNSYYGHMALVESVNGDIITTLNGGYEDGSHIYRVSGTVWEQDIWGYYYPPGLSAPDVTPVPDATKIQPDVYINHNTGDVTVSWPQVAYTECYSVAIKNYNGDLLFYRENVRGQSVSGKISQRGPCYAYIVAFKSSGCTTSLTRPIYLLDIPPTSVSIGMMVNEITLDVGEAYQLQANLNPSYAYASGITWTSSSPSVASVDQNGNVKALKAGGTIIRAKLDNGQEAKVLVRVAAKPIAVKITDSKKVISKGFSYTFRAIATPNNASQKVTWRTGNPKIATVDKNGKVTGKSEGLTWLYAKTTNGKEAKALVKIIPQPSSVKLNYTSKVVTLGKQTKFKATVNPTNANQAVTWRSSNTRVATVDKNGLVKAKGVGTAVITAKTINGKQVTATVKVIPQPQSVKLNTAKRVMRRGTTYKFKATVNPTNANQAVTWRTGNSKIATVDKNGKVTARSTGLTWLYARTVNGKEIRALIKVTK